MASIGVDHQRTLTAVCLREGGAVGRLRQVGDGQRRLIPNAVLGDLWASDAVAAGARPAAGSTRTGPWTDGEDAARFWVRLRGRLYGYLGREEPSVRNGHGLVVALHAGELEPASSAVAGCCQTAGLEPQAYIRATDAILCRWLVEDPAVGAELVAVVAVGDTTTLVAGYRLGWEGGSGRPVVLPGPAVKEIHAGSAQWTARLLDEVRGSMPEPLPPRFEPALQDAALEFGDRLARSGPTQPVAWRGPSDGRMFRPLRLTRDDCRNWPEVAALTSSLPIAVRDALRELAGPRGPDGIVVGGVGATWPFASDAVAASGQLWTSGDPPADVSRGAAWWSDRGLAGRWERASEDPRPLAATRPVEASAPVSVVDETPPWLR